MQGRLRGRKTRQNERRVKRSRKYAQSCGDSWEFCAEEKNKQLRSSCCKPWRCPRPTRMFAPNANCETCTHSHWLWRGLHWRGKRAPEVITARIFRTAMMT